MTSPTDFESLVTRHQGAVCAVAYAVLRDRAVSEDIAQEAFLLAWQKLPGLDPAPSLPEWVCGIARNLARNAARRRKETAMTATTDHASTASSALDHLLERESAELANRALATLGDAEREAIVLYYRGDESLAAVAATLGITEAAAKKRVLRGRGHLRDALGKVEHTLRATRPGPAFTAGCVAALAAGIGARTASAASAAAAAPTSASASASALTAAKRALGVAAVAAAAGAVWLATQSSSDGAAATAPAAAVAAAASPSIDRTRAPLISLTRHLDPAARANLVASLDAARAQRLAAAPARTAAATPQLAVAPAVRTYEFAGTSLFADLPPPAAHERTPGPLTKRELREAIGSVQPLLRECYERTGAGASGSLDLVVRLETEPDVGTIATDARLDGAFAANAELAECARESLLSIEMPALDVGGAVDIYYPFATAQP